MGGQWGQGRYTALSGCAHTRNGPINCMSGLGLNPLQDTRTALVTSHQEHFDLGRAEKSSVSETLDTEGPGGYKRWEEEKP